ncbi:ABC-type sugar transport system ATPase subunit [Thermodesulfitimonas autotrophica]|uniref:ABC-type quaternary amine transporter n=1 Tax=Thermodesulfitimonas autotrophica TaxID=1894989 RepID=A0A3N5BZW9_9THEO|nr:ATP-binding cassette domain-containing protein [Thermodesulfitimonas autotrophica]RPF49431.1 ABC-type sugar transport system ATPase subunit [Thermodesulfitimonas autotrophica]
MLKVENLTVRCGAFTLKEITFQVARGEFFVLLGPTGAGKTVLLETIAGLHFPTRGRVFLSGRDVTLLPPERREIAIVYQDYALFPHLKVSENITYALRFRRQSERKGQDWREVVDLLGIGHLLARYPGSLSGGEKQRVALARALAAQPQMLLLDEPLSALDPATRRETERELKKLHLALGLTTVMVTHNFEEVFALADRVAVILDGALAQVGTPQEVFRSPKSREVARFVGTENFYQPPAFARPDG